MFLEDLMKGELSLQEYDVIGLDLSLLTLRFEIVGNVLLAMIIEFILELQVIHFGDLGLK